MDFTWCVLTSDESVFCDFTEMSEIIENDANNKVKSKREVVKPGINNSPRKVPPFCNGVGSQPCSCYSKNDPNVPQFELSTDEVTRNAVSKNGKSPANCENLKSLGHTLNGFYLVCLDSKMIKFVYCNYNPLISLQHKSSTKNPSTSTKNTAKVTFKKSITYTNFI